ncbi:MAG: Gfo/Idh/MocA family oxidoreductase [Acidimicrobiia bacterium]|nr:Gfo/Idh/MocA family oxidoreductase [Acidimicrobiia bacterium]MDH5235995.1 Gfo/Idh/MocA family oxidoreductase [Acidimicrobiia bacterium]
MVTPRVLFIGGWGHHYLRELAASGARAMTAAACSDGNDDMARLIADGLVGATWFDDPERALVEFAPDIVSVGAVYAHNGRWVERALQAGAAVVSDKPVAAGREQLDRLLEIVAARPGARLATELPARADAAFRTARALVSDGRIGDPILVTAQKSYPFGERPGWYDDPTAYPGTELWVATHAFDFARFVTDRRLTPVAGRSANVGLPQMPSVDDHTVTLCELEGGGTAVVHADYLRPPTATGHGDDRLRVVGSDGIVEVRADRCWWLHDGEPLDVTDPSMAIDPGVLLWDTLADPAVDCTADSLELADTVLAARHFSRASGPRGTARPFP